MCPVSIRHSCHSALFPLCSLSASACLDFTREQTWEAPAPVPGFCLAVCYHFRSRTVGVDSVLSFWMKGCGVKVNVSRKNDFFLSFSFSLTLETQVPKWMLSPGEEGPGLVSARPVHSSFSPNYAPLSWESAKPYHANSKLGLPKATSQSCYKEKLIGQNLGLFGLAQYLFRDTLCL